MYALALLRYRKPLEEVLVHVEDHRAYLRGLMAKGILLVSGPLEPRSGGALLLRVPDEAVDAALVIRQREVFQNRQVRAGARLGVLKHAPDPGRAPDRGIGRNVAPVEQHVPRVGARRAADQVQQRALSAAVAADNADKPPFRHGERKIRKQGQFVRRIRVEAKINLV